MRVTKIEREYRFFSLKFENRRLAIVASEGTSRRGTRC
jgi:hypothetical protein